jgi:hypothetical protein
LKILDTPVHRVIEGYDTLVTLPWTAAQNLPLLNISRTPARFSFTLAFAVAVLAGYGVSVLWDALAKLRLAARYQPYLQWAMVAVISVFILYEYPFFWTNGLPDMPTLAANVPQPIADLVGQDNVRAVLDIPWDQLAFPSVRWSLERFRSGSPPAVFAAAPPLSARTATG